MGKLHVKGWGYLNGKVACQGLGGVRSSLAKSDPREDPKIDPRIIPKIDPRIILFTLLTYFWAIKI